jgi:hypothetical protein
MPRSRIDRSTHGDVNRRPTWFEHRKKALVLQEPHDTRLPVLREMGTRWSYASHRRLSWMRHSRWQHRESPAGRRWLLMQSRCTRCMVPSGDVTFDREIVRSPEGSVVRGAQSGRAAVTRRSTDSRARERSGTTRRRRLVHACEWSKPPPYVGTWFSRFTAVCVGASRMHMAQ